MKKFLKNFEEVVGGSLLIVMFVILVLQIFSRQILDSPLVWSEALAKFIFVYVAYLAIASEIKDDGHVRIDFFFNKLPAKVQTFLHYLYQIAIAGILVIITYLGIIMAIRKETVEIVALNFSYFYMYLALPVLSILMLYRLIEREIKVFRNRKKETEKGVG